MASGAQRPRLPSSFSGASPSRLRPAGTRRARGLLYHSAKRWSFGGCWGEPTLLRTLIDALISALTVNQFRLGGLSGFRLWGFLRLEQRHTFTFAGLSTKANLARLGAPIVLARPGAPIVVTMLAATPAQAYMVTCDLLTTLIAITPHECNDVCCPFPIKQI